jgi:ATP-binding cassette subfamily B protein
MSFPFVQQADAMDCGPSCLKMVSAYHGRNISMESLREYSYITREGVSFLGLSEAAERIGFRTIGVRIPFEKLSKESPLPCIVHWRQKHFIVVYRIKGDKIYVADPALGKVTLSREEFEKEWASTSVEGERQGLVLILQPTPGFYESDDDKEQKHGFRFLFKYINIYRKYFFQLALGLLIGSFIQLILPFLTQSIIDIGINTNDIGFIYIILFAQLALVIGRMSVDFIRSWLLLHIGTRVNISVVSGFLTKLMSLPVSFFDTKFTGDLLQRIEDNNRIEAFLTTSTLNVLFSFFNILIFSIVLAIYDYRILLLFLLGTILYILWVSVFMKSRARLDHKRFSQLSATNSKLIEIINGMQEIKLTQSEMSKRWDWEKLQAMLFKTKVKSLSLYQYQQAGGKFILEISNILITVIAATAVINGDITLGMMLAVQFIIGQLNLPVSQIIGFFRTAQDARMSLDRLAEVHEKDEEESDQDMKVRNLPAERDIFINNLSFQYEGPRSPMVLKDIDIHIPHHKVTAIVGPSGSGKTTLLKMILGFYKPVSGEILIGDTLLSNLSLKLWREKCGVVMQDGFIFPDTIAFNIAPGVETIDQDRLIKAVNVANIRQFLESLPLAYNTKLGIDGKGLSQGQKQRILIARSVYKDPDFLFFDEATNSLDANNEKVITDNLTKFYRGKTVLIVAHRLSTVMHADNIIVLDSGRIVETGSHDRLISLKGYYYNLVKNQLELGN